MTFLPAALFMAALVGAASFVDSFTAQPAPLSRRRSNNAAAVALTQDTGPRLDGDAFALNIYSSYGYGAGWDYDYGGGLRYGTDQYRQRYNDGYFGGVNLSHNGYSQQTNVARGRGRIGDDYMYGRGYYGRGRSGYGGRGGYWDDYDDYGGYGRGGYGRGGYGGYGRGYGRGGYGGRGYDDYYYDDYYW